MSSDSPLPQEFRGQGEYRHLYWDMLLLGDTFTPTYELASLHELFHSDLDTTTDFGTLLSVLAYLSRCFGESSVYGTTHRNLVRASKRTHETYATYLSLLAVSGPGATDGAGYALQEYEEYVRIGSDLCRGLTGRFFRFHAALAALRICMQGPVTRIALERSLEGFRPRDLDPTLLPDERLTAVRQIVTEPNFWQGALDRLRNEAADHPEWEHALATEVVDDTFTELFRSDEGSLSAHLLRGFHRILAERMERLGMSTLPYGGHMELAKHLVEAAQVRSGGRAPGGFALTAGELDEGLLGAALHFERERTVIRTERVRAALLPVPVEQYLSEIADSLESPDFLLYVAVRWPERLADQFAFSREDAETLRSQAGQPWCFVQSGVHDEDGYVVLLVPLRSPADVAVLAAAGPCLSSVSSAVLNREDWRAWREALASSTTMTVLWDTSPFRQIQRWASDGVRRVRFGREEVRTEAGRYSLYWIRPDSEGAPMFIAPVSFVVTVALSVYLKRMAELHGFELVGDGAHPEDISALRPVAFHLFREESWFDFSVNVD